MSVLEILQLVGYGTGAALTLWMGTLLLKSRRVLGGVERVLLALAVSIGLWHACNLVLVLHALLGFGKTRWVYVLQVTDSLTIISIVVAYSLLLHLHLYLWANARKRKLTLTERARIYLSYIPTIFLVRAIPYVWSDGYAPMFEKLAQLQFLASPSINFVQAFMLWAAYVLIFISVTDFAISYLSLDHGEKRFMKTLAGSFLLIASLIVAVYLFGVGRGRMLGPYLATIANLGSLLPTALLAQRIYRERFLDLVIRESLVVATFAAVVLIVYLFGIRAVGAWSTQHYGVRSAVVESLLILTLALAARPLRKWLEKRFRRLFEREAKLYREVVARIGAHQGQFENLAELLQFIEERTAKDLGLRRVRLFALKEADGSATSIDSPSTDSTIDLLNGIVPRLDQNEGRPIEGDGRLKELGWAVLYPLMREGRTVGLMLVDAAADTLTQDIRGVLEVVCGQVALAIEDHRLIEANVRLELRVAQDARLAALGQMAATVAHEVKNPLSAIKSIAQVLREDENLQTYERDLDMIVGETDRLNNSVTQLLSFARHAPQAGSPARVDELIQSIIDLFRAQAERSGVRLKTGQVIGVEVSGPTASALRDALSNLLLNAIQATASGGSVNVDASHQQSELVITVSDTGPGIAPGLEERIWEPFFTTKQRGTGLGLAIVRKRIEEVGGTINLALSGASDGTRFELHLPFVAQL